jgi:hypothetical protein
MLSIGGKIFMSWGRFFLALLLLISSAAAQEYVPLKIKDAAMGKNGEILAIAQSDRGLDIFARQTNGLWEPVSNQVPVNLQDLSPSCLVPSKKGASSQSGKEPDRLTCLP